MNINGTKNKELFYDSIAEDWEEKINKPETNKRLRIVYKILFDGIPLKGKKFLDVGCGLGFFAFRAGKLGAEVHGIDIGKRLVRISSKRYPKGKFIVAPAQKLPFKSNSFDLVLCTEVIEHVNKQNKVLDELFRVLKKDGYLILTTPNRLFHPLYTFLCSIGVRPYHGNEYWYFPWEIKRALEKRGKVTKKYYFNFILPNPFFDQFERFSFLKYLMVHQGYLVAKEKNK